MLGCRGSSCRSTRCRRLQTAARVLPLTSAVSLLRGIWRGEGWTAHAGDVAGLALVFLICTAISAKVFRWE